jgi:hypothetical protein
MDGFCKAGPDWSAASVKLNGGDLLDVRRGPIAAQFCVAEQFLQWAIDPERTSALRQPDDPHPFIDDAFDLGGVEGIELPSTLALPLRSDLRSAGRLRRLVELTNDVQHPRLFL